VVVPGIIGQFRSILMDNQYSLARGLHFLVTAFFAAVVLILAVLVVVGTVEVRLEHSPQATVPTALVSPKEPDGLWVREVAEAKEYFRLLGHQAYLYKYSGGWIDAWIEVEEEGQKTTLGKELGEQLRTNAVGEDRIGPSPTGYLLWVRRKEHAEEVWELALSINGKDGKSFGWVHDNRISPPRPKSGVGIESSGISLREGDGDIVLNEGQIVVLDGFRNGDGRKGRKVELKCRLAR
jgi:hypothetical protein